MSLIPTALLAGNALSIIWISKHERAYLVTRRTALVGLLIASLLGVTCCAAMLLASIDHPRAPPRTVVNAIGSMLFSAFLMGFMWHGILVFLRSIKIAAEFLRRLERQQDPLGDNASVAPSESVEPTSNPEKDL
jgi:hypothetical protein